MQDGPFLCLRLGLIIHYRIISQSNVFFTTKNFLVVLLQIYRVCVIIIEHRKHHRLARLHDMTSLHSKDNQLPAPPRKSITGSRRRSSTLLKTPRGSFLVQSNSMANIRPFSVNSDCVSFDGNLYSSPRRKRSSVLSINTSSFPSARSTTPHSDSLTIVEQPAFNVTSQKICTEV